MPGWAFFAGIAASAIWVLGVLLIGHLRATQRPQALVAAVILGVPILGWVTWKCGPLLGLLAFLIGLAMLLRPQPGAGPRAAGRLPQPEGD